MEQRRRGERGVKKLIVVSVTFILPLLISFTPFALAESKATLSQQHPYDTTDVTGPRPMASLYDEGFWLVSPEDKLRIWAWAQEDYRAFSPNYPLPDTFLNRRVRLAVLGTLEYHFNYMLMAAFERSTDLVQFAWVEWAQLGWIKARMGQFKEPFSMEELTTDVYLDTLERSIIVTNLSPAFDIGAMLHGYVWDDKIEYAVGAFNGRGRTREDNRNDKNVASRIVIQPFRADENSKWLKQFYIGVNGTWGVDEESLAGTSYTTAGATRFWTYANGVGYLDERWRLGTDLIWVYGPYSFKTEWNRSVFQNIANATQITNGIFDGWYITATWLVTGEDKQRGTKPVKPNKNFDPLKNQWGALELVFRFEQFLADNSPLLLSLATGTAKVNATTLGLNWYFNPQVRGAFNYVQSDFANAIVVNRRTIDRENLFLFRAQFEI